jgi:hypothetical protein
MNLRQNSIADMPAGSDGFRRKGPNLIGGLEVREMSQSALCAVQPVLPSFNLPMQPSMSFNRCSLLIALARLDIFIQANAADASLRERLTRDVKIEERATILEFNRLHRHSRETF